MGARGGCVEPAPAATPATQVRNSYKWSGMDGSAHSFAAHAAFCCLQATGRALGSSGQQQAAEGASVHTHHVDHHVQPLLHCLPVDIALIVCVRVGGCGLRGWHQPLPSLPPPLVTAAAGCHCRCWGSRNPSGLPHCSAATTGRRPPASEVTGLHGQACTRPWDSHRAGGQQICAVYLA